MNEKLALILYVTKKMYYILVHVHVQCMCMYLLVLYCLYEILKHLADRQRYYTVLQASDAA